MNLEELLLEDKMIKEKITNAVDSMKDWFEKKKDQSKELFDSIKEKVLSVLKKPKKNWKVMVDVYDKDGNKIIEAGASSEKVRGKIGTVMNDIKNLCKDIIEFCQDGIKSLMGKEVTKAKGHKNKVTEFFNKLSDSIGIMKKLVSIVNKYAEKKAEYIVKRDGARNRSRERALDRKEERLRRKFRHTY